MDWEGGGGAFLHSGAIHAVFLTEVEENAYCDNGSESFWFNSLLNNRL